MSYSKPNSRDEIYLVFTENFLFILIGYVTEKGGAKMQKKNNCHVQTKKMHT